MFRVILAAAMLAFMSAGVSAQGLLDLLTGGLNSGKFWQGSWGTEGKTPLISINGSEITYEGANGQTYTVSMVTIAAAKVTFIVGQSQVALTKRLDNNVDMVSTVGEHASDTILLCKADAPHCP